MNELPKDGRTIAEENPFAGATSGRIARILDSENRVIPMSAKDKVRMVCFAGKEEQLKAHLMEKIGDKQLLTSGVQVKADEFFEQGFGIVPTRKISGDRELRMDNYRRRLSILEDMYGKEVYDGRKITDNMEEYQLGNMYTFALLEIRSGYIKS